MSIVRKTIREASWLGIFKLISQVFSWSITILIARILVPADYGLMAMATIITGYAMMFSELGIGAAIIQRPNPTQEDLSSVFWFALVYSALIGLGCFVLAYPAALLFNEPMVTPIMQMISITFIFSGLQIVPSNLLRKRLEFKKFGIIELIVIVISSVSMLIIAYLGGGVWTLVVGIIMRAVTKLVLIYLTVKWFPKFHFDFQKTKSYLRFGIILSISRTFYYTFEQSDKFFAARVWPADTLGYYSFALQLAQIPVDRIVSLINQVSFPLLSQLQDNEEKFSKVYIGIVKITATLVIPLYVGGYLLGDLLVRVLLSEQWLPIIFLFKYLCLIQIMTSLNAINTRVHVSQGRPHWSLWYHLTCATLMATSFYFSVQHGLKAILIPWFTTYILICSALIILTINKIGVKLFAYLKALFNPLMGTLTMAISIQIFSYSMIVLPFELNLISGLIIKIVIGAAIYVGYLWFFDREFFDVLRDLRKGQ